MSLTSASGDRAGVQGAEAARADKEGQRGRLDPRRLKVHRVPLRDVPYVPTDEPVVAAMLRFAGVGPSDVVYDLGCGDGRIVIAAAKHYGCRGVGVDIDPLRVAESREGAARARVGERVRFVCQSFFETDLREATVVMLYLLPSINVKLTPKLLHELRPGARIVANYFGMGDWKPDMRAEAHHRVLHQWVVPAWVGGTWSCVIGAPGAGGLRGGRGRRRMSLRLRRRFQEVTGTAKVDGIEVPVAAGRLFGSQMTFKLFDPERRRPAYRFWCDVGEQQMRGTCQLAGWDATPVAWGGRRVGAEA